MEFTDRTKLLPALRTSLRWHRTHDHPELADAIRAKLATLPCGGILPHDPRNLVACCGRWHAVDTLPLTTPCCGRRYFVED